MKKNTVLSMILLAILCTGCQVPAEHSVEFMNSKSENDASVTSAEEVTLQADFSDLSDKTIISEVTMVSAESDDSLSVQDSDELSEIVKETEISFNDNSESETTVTALNENKDIGVVHPAPNIYGYTPFFYQLTSEEQAAYDELVQGLSMLSEEIKISVPLDSEQLSKVYDAVLLNMEQQLYAPVREYVVMTYETTGKVHSVKPGYPYDAAKLESTEKAVSDAAGKILSGITEEMTVVDKIKHIHDLIILNCDYSDAGKESANAYGALVDGSAVCEGYSRAMSYVCRKTGINCEIVTGTADGVPHMWNMVEVDGKWYNIDLTWDDPVISNDNGDYISYAYFNVSDSYISRTHIPDTSRFSYPVSYADDANYFVYYKRYIGSADECADVIYNGISDTVNSDEKAVVFRFDNQQLFNDEISYLFDDAWSGFFEIVDKYNSENENRIDKNNISVKKDVENCIIRISF